MTKITLDPHTARTLAALKTIIKEIEAGESGLTRFSDVLVHDDGGLQRIIEIRTTYGPKATK